MKLIYSALWACLSLSLASCDGSGSSSDDAPAPVADVPGAANAVPGTGSIAATEGAATSTSTSPSAGESTVDSGTSPNYPAVSEFQEAIKLNSGSIEYKLLQYDCGAIASPLNSPAVEAQLKGVKSFQTLAATFPAKDQALIKVAANENGVDCSYRAIFSVNKAFTQVTYVSSQALNGDSFTSCNASKTAIDGGFGLAPISFEYDKKFVLWVALLIPADMQTSPVCSTGKLRAVFADPSL